MSTFEKYYRVTVHKAGKDVDPSKQQLKFRITTGSVDRQNDTINPKGWTNLAAAKGMPFLWAHDASIPPVGKLIKAWRDGDAVDAIVEFTPADMDHPLGRGFGSTVYRMYDEGFLGSVSVGFRALDWDRSDDRDGGIDFRKQELLEVSAVPVPANREAIVQMALGGMQELRGWASERLDKAADSWAHKSTLVDFCDALDSADKTDDEPIAVTDDDLEIVEDKNTDDLATVLAAVQEVRASVEALSAEVKTLGAREPVEDTVKAIEPAPESVSDPEEVKRIVRDALGAVTKRVFDDIRDKSTGRL